MSNLKAEVTMDWADGVYTFRLTVPRAIELEQVCAAPFAVILQRLETGAWHVEDVRQTIRLGLIGGGTKPADAVRLVRDYVDAFPLAESWPVARAVLAGLMFGFKEVPIKPGNRKAAASRKNSTPQPSTEPQPSQA